MTPPRLLVASLLAASLVLTGCSGGDDGKGDTSTDKGSAKGGRVTTQDGVASLVIPKGWADAGVELDGPVVLVASSQADPFEQVLVSSFPKAGDAEDAAVFSSTGMVQSGGTCTRLEDDRTFGGPNLVFDCAFTGPELHKVFVVRTDGARSALVLVQTAGKTLADTAEVVTPILDSWRWS